MFHWRINNRAINYKKQSSYDGETNRRRKRQSTTMTTPQKDLWDKQLPPTAKQPQPVGTFQCHHSLSLIPGKNRKNGRLAAFLEEDLKR